jgi:uncharacterized protein YdeI (YjbR/CyaY-like superfamily)
VIKTENFDQVEISSTEDLKEWLAEHHTQKESVWVITYKKISKDKYVSVDQILDELICYGWIDGIRRKVDEFRTMQLISPRKTQYWAKSYKDRANRLIKDGKMQPAGHLSIEQAKKNGLWNFMDDVDQLIIPDDLAARLSENETARSFFNQINDSSKRFALRWLKLSKTAKTRKNRIEKLYLLSLKEQKLPGS